MVPFGQWLKTNRDAKGHTTIRLGQLAGVNGSNISRLEVHPVQPVMTTVYKVVTALGVSPEQLLSELLETPIETFMQRVEFSDAPSVEDTIEFLKRSREDVLTLTLSVLNAALHKVVSLEPRHEIGVGELERHIQVLTLKVPLKAVLSPPDWTAEFPRRVFRADGLLRAAEIGSYLAARRAIIEEGQEVTRLKPLYDRTGLLRRSEAGIPDQGKLGDAMLLDSLLSEQHEIFGMYWRLAAFQTAYDQLPKHIVLDAELLAIMDWWLTGLRWLQQNPEIQLSEFGVKSGKELNTALS